MDILGTKKWIWIWYWHQIGDKDFQVWQGNETLTICRRCWSSFGNHCMWHIVGNVLGSLSQILKYFWPDAAHKDIWPSGQCLEQTCPYSKIERHFGALQGNGRYQKLKPETIELKFWLEILVLPTWTQWRTFDTSLPVIVELGHKSMWCLLSVSYVVQGGKYFIVEILHIL